MEILDIANNLKNKFSDSIEFSEDSSYIKVEATKWLEISECLKIIKILCLII